MNVAQYKPSNTMRAAALESLSRFASISEAASAAGERAAEERAERYTSPAAYNIGGASCLCDFAPDGTVRLAKCETDARAFDVPETVAGHPVAIIGPHAFSTCYQLERVNLPDGIAELGEYAFMNTALGSFTCPAGLRGIGKNAFYKCARLERVCLNEGLLSIGECAFRESAVSSLFIPASVENIGHDAFKDTRLTASGERPTLRIAPGNPRYGLLDGALYHVGEDGLELVQLLDETAQDYCGPEGLVAVLARAFAGCRRLSRVSLPYGVVAVEDAAFKGCKSLAGVEMPDSVRHIGKHAFWDTSLAHVRIPAALETVGTAAFYTGNSIARNFHRTIGSVSIAPGNTTFQLHDGMLRQHREAAGDIVLLYIGDAERIVIPRDVTAIGPYAFLKARNVREVHIHDGLEAIDVGGFDFGHAVIAVIYDVYEGDTPSARYVVRFPPGEAGRQAVRQTFARGRFDLSYAFASADNAILITQDTLVRSKAMLERMADPVMLDANMRAEYLRKLGRTLLGTIVAFGKGGFPQGIDLLFGYGLLNGENVDDAIRTASEAGEIAVLSRLMELKRTKCAAKMFDFDL